MTFGMMLGTRFGMTFGRSGAGAVRGRRDRPAGGGDDRVRRREHGRLDAGRGGARVGDPSRVERRLELELSPVGVELGRLPGQLELRLVERGAPSAGDDGGSSSSASDDAATTSSEAGDDGPATTTADAAPACVKGQVTPNEVVMLGDSYLDPAWGNIGPTLMMQANAMYRHYYIGGAAMAWGNPNTQFFVPYQFDPMALTDISVMNPADIKVVIMDSGSSDVLIGNTSCETTAPPMNTSCVTTVQTAMDEAKSKMQEMQQKGVKDVVFFFYPHLSTAGGGILRRRLRRSTRPSITRILSPRTSAAARRSPRARRTTPATAPAHPRHELRFHRHADLGLQRHPRRLHQERQRPPDAGRGHGHLEPHLDPDAGALHRAVVAKPTTSQPTSAPRATGAPSWAAPGPPRRGR